MIYNIAYILTVLCCAGRHSVLECCQVIEHATDCSSCHCIMGYIQLYYWRPTIVCLSL